MLRPNPTLRQAIRRWVYAGWYALTQVARYAPACIKLLAQYKSLMKLVGDEIGGLETFMKRYKVSLPLEVRFEAHS